MRKRMPFIRPYLLPLILISCLLAGFSACQKDQLIAGTALSLYNSIDSIKFNEVFTTQVQPTQSVKIFNGSEQAVNITRLQLAGGHTSPFKINVNGQPGTDFNDLHLAKNDSFYVFITVNLPENKSDAPFEAKDSIIYQYGGKTGKITLQATGLNAFYLSKGSLSKDTTWTNKRPIVINDNLTIEKGVTLSIKPGTKVYTKAGKGIIINGRLQAIGTTDSAGQILFTGSRLDEPYNNMPGSWQGLSFGADSKNNILRYVHIKNAVNGIADTSRAVTGGDPGSESYLTLEGCVVMQSRKEALLFRHASALLNNCLIYNSGIGIRAMGGHYKLQYVTMAAYSNDYIYHADPLLYLADHNETGHPDPLTFTVTNCIITGDNDPMDELYLDNINGAFQLDFKNDLLKAGSLPPLGHFSDCLLNVDPGFALIDNRRAVYDFQLLSVSPAKDAGLPVNGITTDMTGQLRSASSPSLGCYEFKEAATK